MITYKWFGLCFCRSNRFFAGLGRLGGGFAAIDNYFGWAFVHCSFGLLIGLVSGEVYPGQIVLHREYICLFGTDATADTAHLTYRPCALARLLTVTGNNHHILINERNHFNQTAWAGLRAGRTAGALLIVNDSHAVNNVQSIKLARPRTIAKAQAAEPTGLHICQCISRTAG